LRKKTYLECNIVIFYLFWEAVNRNGYLWVRNSAHKTNYYFRAPRLHSVLIEELYLPFHFFQIIFFYLLGMIFYWIVTEMAIGLSRTIYIYFTTNWNFLTESKFRIIRWQFR
jgi:hypothetical protein